MRGLHSSAHLGSISDLSSFHEIITIGVADEGDFFQGGGVVGNARATVKADEVRIGSISINRWPVATNGHDYLIFGIFILPFTEQSGEGVECGYCFRFDVYEELKWGFSPRFPLDQGFIQGFEVEGLKGAFRPQILSVVGNQQLTVHQPDVGFDGMESLLKGVAEGDGLFVIVV
jgi:hypothetical protein